MLEELRVIQGNKEKFGHLVFNKRIFVPEDAVYIGRGSKWGNQWSHLPSSLAAYKVGSREEAVVMHSRDLKKRLENGTLSLKELSELADKNLVCFCSPNLCHGHTLAAASSWAKEQLSNRV